MQIKVITMVIMPSITVKAVFIRASLVRLEVLTQTIKVKVMVTMPSITVKAVFIPLAIRRRRAEGLGLTWAPMITNPMSSCAWRLGVSRNPRVHRPSSP